MPHKADGNIEANLALVRYALGFRDVERSRKTGYPDHGRGSFQRQLLDTLDRYWGTLRQSSAWDSDSGSHRKPSDASIRRWFSGYTRPYQRSLHILVELLNITLEEWRSSGRPTLHSAEKDPTIQSDFKFHPDDLVAAPRSLAPRLGVDITEFDLWFAGKQNAQAERKEQSRFGRFSGFYFAYRLSAHDPNVVHKSVVMIRQSYDTNDLEIRTIERSGRSWSGLLTPGRNTLSGMLTNKDEFEGTRVNGISLIYDANDADILSGVTTRVLDAGGAHLVSFRTVLVSTTAIDMQYMRDIGNPETAEYLASLFETIDIDNIPEENEVAQVQKFLLGKDVASNFLFGSKADDPTAFVANFPTPRSPLKPKVIEQLGKPSKSKR